MEKYRKNNISACQPQSKCKFFYIGRCTRYRTCKLLQAVPFEIAAVIYSESFFIARRVESEKPSKRIYIRWKIYVHWRRKESFIYKKVTRVAFRRLHASQKAFDPKAFLRSYVRYAREIILESWPQKHKLLRRIQLVSKCKSCDKLFFQRGVVIFHFTSLLPLTLIFLINYIETISRFAIRIRNFVTPFLPSYRPCLL